ncbi:MAG: DNA-processing protein DprA, partial [Chthonomonas sp.]|nr:DNA-processing protein DprA [Chthonomonas sp.]
MAETLIAVIGAAECEPFVATMATEVGRGIADMGAVLVSGGRSGVMEAASRGAKERGGKTVGILPGDKPF